MVKKIIYIFILLTSFSALYSCDQGDSDELTLEQLQKDEINQLYKFKVRATVNIDPFNANYVNLLDLDTVFQIQARSGSEILSLYLPYLGVGTFYGSTDSKVSMAHIDSKGRYFISNIPKFNSDVRVTLTEVDTVLNIINGSFSGTLYDPSSKFPEQAEYQVKVHSGQLIRVNF